ncbi:hypothetical protein LguiB_014014 [Lonicera macranthoides]
MGKNPNQTAKCGSAADSVSFFNLPNDISMFLFSKLPVNSILCCRCVCKQWRRLLSDPEFVETHLNHSRNCLKVLLRSGLQSFYTIYYEASNDNYDILCRDFPLKSCYTARILGSCNGLLCVGVATDRTKKVRPENYKIVLWNPSTGDHKMLPDANRSNEIGSCRSNQLVGFGYDSFSRDYKIVRVISRPRYQVDVYSLKSNSWKAIESAPRIRSWISLNVVAGTLTNGSIYWLLDKHKGEQLDRWIVHFDLEDEKLVELQLPQPSHPHRWYNVKLMVIGGCLGVYCVYWNLSHIFVVLWMLKEDKKDEWTKLANFSHNGLERMSFLLQYNKPLCLFENGKILLHIAYFDLILHHVALLVYDPKLNSIVKRIPIQENTNGCKHHLVAYIETLVSPNAWVA